MHSNTITRAWVGLLGQAFRLAALKTDRPITGNITGSCHIRE